MAMDASRDGDRVIVRLDLPGVDPDSIEVTVDRNVLTITAERSWEPAEGQAMILTERRQGRFNRQVFLGDSLDADGIEASYDRGVLTLTIPVAEQAKPRKVQGADGRRHRDHRARPRRRPDGDRLVVRRIS
jgi:HSP20 family protein